MGGSQRSGGRSREAGVFVIRLAHPHPRVFSGCVSSGALDPPGAHDGVEPAPTGQPHSGSTSIWVAPAPDLGNTTYSLQTQRETLLSGPLLVFCCYLLTPLLLVPITKCCMQPPARHKRRLTCRPLCFYN